MVRRPAIQEQPLLTAIARVREWNSVLQQAAAVTQALEQQKNAHADSHPSPTYAAASHLSSTADGTEGSDAASASSLNQQTGAQHAQHGGQGLGFKPTRAKHAQQGANAPAGQLPDAAGEGESDDADSASAAQHKEDSSVLHERAADTQVSSTNPDKSFQQHTLPSQVDAPQQTHDARPSAKPQGQTANDSQSPVASQQAQQQQQAGVPSMHSMPAQLPPMGALKCVLESGEQLSMVDGLQGLVVGLALKILTGQVGTTHFSEEVTVRLSPALSRDADDQSWSNASLFTGSSTSSAFQLHLNLPCVSAFCDV